MLSAKVQALQLCSAWTFADNMYINPLSTKGKSRADDNLFFVSYFSEKIMLDITCEPFAWQTIHM